MQSRVKSLKSYEDKIKSGDYKDPKLVQDLVGIRIICYVESEIVKIQKIIKDNFLVDKKKLIDKSIQLGTNKVGYRSTHIIAELNNKRNGLPEYKRIKDFHFEIQITTILQHAWSEFGHDRNYKFTGILPKELERRMNLHAGTLENIDKDFDNIAKELEKYSKEVEHKTKRGQLKISIDSTSLKQYMDKTYSDIVDRTNFSLPDKSSDAIDELKVIGVTTLEELEKITSKDFKNDCKKIKDLDFNYLGLIRSIMIIHNSEKYMKNARKTKWNNMTGAMVDVLSQSGIDVKEFAKKYGVNILH